MVFEKKENMFILSFLKVILFPGVIINSSNVYQKGFIAFSHSLYNLAPPLLHVLNQKSFFLVTFLSLNALIKIIFY